MYSPGMVGGGAMSESESFEEDQVSFGKRVSSSSSEEEEEDGGVAISSSELQSSSNSA